MLHTATGSRKVAYLFVPSFIVASVALFLDKMPADTWVNLIIYFGGAIGVALTAERWGSQK